MRSSTGDTTVDAVVLLATIAIACGGLALLAWPFERTERGRRIADRLLRLIFP